jgi:hypothetical protein
MYGCFLCAAGHCCMDRCPLLRLLPPLLLLLLLLQAVGNLAGSLTSMGRPPVQQNGSS